MAVCVIWGSVVVCRDMSAIGQEVLSNINLKQHLKHDIKYIK